MKISNAVLAARSASLAALLLSGCGGMSVGGFMPFGGDGRELSRIPPNSIAYQCQAGKRFFLRYLEEGAAVWVILPEREFRLEKVTGDQGTRYGTGRTVLRIGEGEATLSDGSAASYAGCRIPSAEPAPKPAAAPAEPPAAKPAAKP